MNRGARHLAEQVREWVAQDPDNRSQNGAAGRVDCDTGNFSKILRGERLPGRAVSAKIRQEFGTEPEWFDEEEKSAPVTEPAA
jgi:hypothetical protein